MLKIIPEPQYIEYADVNKKFAFDNSIGISADDECRIATANLKGYLTTVFNVKTTENPAKIVTFVKTDDLHAEGYSISVNENIDIRYSTSAGALYAVETLKQAISSSDNAIPYVFIADYPQERFRAFMIDTGRYFFQPRDIYALIDVMVINKLNVLHWHISEDQGWRIEIDAFKELTIKGSMRSHTNFGRRKHGGFYTKSEVKDIVAYCHERNITVIPELDIPGHSQAAIACYPYLSCFDRKLPVATHWGVKHDLLCAGKDSTYEFVKRVIDELLELFPDEYFHIGGDEAVKTRWKLCPHCQKKIKDLHLKDENQLQAYFTNIIAEYLQSKGKKVMTWNEFEFSEILNRDIIWILYASETKIAERIATDGRKFVNAMSIPYYLDLPYGTNSLKKVYEFNARESVKGNNELMLGTEACLWTEFVPNLRQAYKMIFPRIAAFAERAWSKSVNYSQFINKTKSYYEYIHSMGIKTPKSIAASNSKALGLLEKLWFERRKLCWAGLHNAVDNYSVKIKHTKKSNK